VELKAAPNDVLLVPTVAEVGENRVSKKVLMYDFKRRQLLTKISFDFPLKYLFLTPDRSFLVIVGEKTMAFYHLGGEYFYYECDMDDSYQFPNVNVNIWQDRRFARKINDNRSVIIFDFDK
jgi:hypothetical protein